MTKQPIVELLSDWVEKQSRGEEPFWFHHWMDSKGEFVEASYPKYEKTGNKKKGQVKQVERVDGNDSSEGDNESDELKPKQKAKKRSLTRTKAMQEEGDDLADNSEDSKGKSAAVIQKSKAKQRKGVGSDVDVGELAEGQWTEAHIQVPTPANVNAKSEQRLKTHPD